MRYNWCVYLRKKTMLVYREGAKIGSLCANCGKKVSATLKNETLSLCKGLKEVENALVLACDECGNMTGIPAKSMLPIQQAAESLIDSKQVSKIEEVTVELKSLLNKEKFHDKESRPDYQHEHPLQATG